MAITGENLGRFRKWYTQYRATHGMPPPRGMVTDFLKAELESEASRATQSRALSLQEEFGRGELALGEKRIGLAERELGIAERGLDLRADEIKAQAGAARISGLGTLAVGGAMIGKEMGLFGVSKAIGAAGAAGTVAGGAATGVGAASGAYAGGGWAAATGAGGPAAGAAVGGGGALGGMSLAGAGMAAGAGAIGGMIGSKIFSGEPKMGGAAGGAAGGFLVGGPIGAVIGGVIGWVTGGK